ncbi:uncharacterized protein LOC107862227 isoform X3 [Capsicum annuum]|uniref:uncharacterized protein LOC107862227 isoform X3 n=1 Tax=Capsicum annuum TaxID=4072 RepID=UPI001FB0CDBF|nr:uncharacterized protein LOC107862227 isoform X3 [Capsicum annuum]
MEPWEALDVDDSDLHSLLRPCKRLHQNPNPSTSTSTSSSAAPLLTPPLVVENSDHQLQSPPQRLIPGPAGAVQAAMIQRTYDLQCHNSISSQGDNPIPTQEYIRRAVENSTDFDYDFQSNPWLCALEFVGAENGKIPCTPLSSVNKCLQSARVDQVVAVVKSCTQNGLGGLIVTLKVAVFCPSSSAYYLNITLGNLTKVFCKESGPPLVNSRAAYKVNYSDPESASASARKASALQITDDETIEEILDDRTIECSAGGNFRNEIQMEKENLVPDNYICNNNSGFEKTSVEYKECLQQTQSSAIEFGAVRSRGTCNENNNQQMEECSQGTLTPRNKRESPKKNHFDPDILVTDVFKDHRQPIASKVSLPQWTDDQLDELFACEDDDE